MVQRGTVTCGLIWISFSKDGSHTRERYLVFCGLCNDVTRGPQRVGYLSLSILWRDERLAPQLHAHGSTALDGAELPSAAALRRRTRSMKYCCSTLQFFIVAVVAVISLLEQRRRKRVQSSRSIGCAHNSLKRGSDCIARTAIMRNSMIACQRAREGRVLQYFVDSECDGSRHGKTGTD